MSQPLSWGQVVLPVALSCILAAAAVAAGLFSIWQTRVLARLFEERATALADRSDSAVGALRSALDELEEQVRHLPASGGAGAPLPKSGLNLLKRSQVLRLHRRGEAPERIAASLEVPLQEVDLLLKVHRIVIGNLARK